MAKVRLTRPHVGPRISCANECEAAVEEKQSELPPTLVLATWTAMTFRIPGAARPESRIPSVRTCCSAGRWWRRRQSNPTVRHFACKDQRSVDPDLETVIEQGLDPDPLVGGGVRGSEGSAQVERAVDVPHVQSRAARRGRSEDIGVVPHRCGTGGPGGIVEVDRPPSPGRGGRFIRAFPVLPNSGGGDERDVGQDGGCGGGGAPMAAEGIVERGVDQFERVAWGVADGRPGEAEL